MRTKERAERRSKNNRLAILLILIAIVILIGVSVAFFSDFVTGQVGATSGTLKLDTSTTTIEHNGTTVNSPIANLNPGDMITVSWTVENLGNKSAYTRNIIKLTGSDFDSNVLRVYPGDTADADIIANNATAQADEIAWTSGEGAIAQGPVLNGVGTGAESETDGVDGTQTITYKIYFDKTAGNDYQNKTLAIDVRTDALQYRNNSEASDVEDAVWNSVESAANVTIPTP